MMFWKKNKVVQIANHLLLIADKIENYRGDVMTAAQRQSLNQARQMISSAATLPMQSASIHFNSANALLQSIGGDIYPMTGLTENAEVFLFAAILALAVRAFFFQPFKIPTNSMYPTYAGMQYELVQNTRSWPEKFKRWCLLGASNYKVLANSTGPVKLPIAVQGDKTGPYGGNLYYKVINTRKYFGLIGAQEREYTFFVGDQPATLRVPLEFNLDDVALATFFPGAHSWKEVLDHQSRSNFQYWNNNDHRTLYFNTGVAREKGKPIVDFDILSGDVVFVNKVSYHFSLPRVGDAFVFRTREIEQLHGEDKYFIKRLVGVPGDQLSVQNRTLVRNGQPITGAEAFELNHSQRCGYPGYTNVGLLDKDQSVLVDDHSYFAMGDNSPESSDSRFWGFVPEQSVIGKAAFIMYPFTKRWGTSH